MIEKKEFPLCEAVIERINNRFVNNGWLTLYEDRVFTVLVTDKILSTSMEHGDWELSPSNAKPFINEYDDKADGYQRFYKEGVEPLVYIQEKKGPHPECIKLIDELVVFYDLRINHNVNGDIEYILVDECGEDNVVAHVKDGHAEIMVKYAKEFAAIKKMHLLVQFDININCDKALTEMSLSPCKMAKHQYPDIIFEYCLNDGCGIIPEYKSFAWICGKCCITCDKEDVHLFWNYHDPHKEDFIVGVDNEGHEIISTCDATKLPNLFSWDGKSIYTLTPVFFKKEVLRKYYDDPQRFSVQDGAVRGIDWEIHADTDRDDGFVAVTLVDLGRLPYKEQQYWKQFNVITSPGTTLSSTSLERWIKGKPCNAQNSMDFIFKNTYISLNKKWKQHYGWFLLKPLAKGDEFHWTSLRVMTNKNNDVEFHSLLQSITLIVVDSLNEAELTKNTDGTKQEVIDYLANKDCVKPSDLKGGIAKLELFLISIGNGNEDLIKLWKNIQGLRSTNVAHRKSSNPTQKDYELMQWFKMDQCSQREVINYIYEMLVNNMKWLESIF